MSLYIKSNVAPCILRILQAIQEYVHVTNKHVVHHSLSSLEKKMIIFLTYLFLTTGLVLEVSKKV